MKILKVYQQKLRFKNYSKNTIEIYSCYLEKFLISENIKDPYQVTTKQITNYLENKTYSSISMQNQYIGSLKLFAKYILNKKQMNLAKIERPKKEKKLPQIIDHDYIITQLSKITNLKHKAILSLAYSGALRVSEVINLKMRDIDRERMIINIRNAKGRKDRIIPLSKNILQLIEKYYRKYKPVYYLFNGQTKPQYTPGSCNKIVKLYLGAQYHFHQLRHASATQLYENGTEIYLIQKLLGHSNIKTTEIYTHISNRTLSKMKLAI